MVAAGTAGASASLQQESRTQGEQSRQGGTAGADHEHQSEGQAGGCTLPAGNMEEQRDHQADRNQDLEQHQVRQREHPLGTDFDG